MNEDEIKNVLKMLDVDHIVVIVDNPDFEGYDSDLRYLQKRGLVKLSENDPDEIVGAVLTDTGRRWLKMS